MLSNFLDFLISGVFDLLSGLLSLFPHMPDWSTTYEELFENNLVMTVLGWVNYFLPINIASTIIALWATAMMAYVAIKVPVKYGYSIIR